MVVVIVVLFSGFMVMMLRPRSMPGSAFRLANRDGSPNVGLPRPGSLSELEEIVTLEKQKALDRRRVQLAMFPRYAHRTIQEHKERKKALERYRSYWRYHFIVKEGVDRELRSMGVNHVNALAKKQ